MAGPTRRLRSDYRSNPDALRAIRMRAGHTPGSLAKASGVSKARIYDLETGSLGVRPTTAKKLADALGVPIDAITLPSNNGGTVR